MKNTALAHGAATIIAAFATGKGAALGLDLYTKAEVELQPEGITAEIKGFPEEDTTLLECCCRQVLQHFRMKGGVKISTESNIPIARGLKSSSVAANATVLACTAAIAREKDLSYSEEELINLGIEAAFQAGVTVTGALDDASASFFGGYTLTDNLKREILGRGRVEDLYVYLLVPETKSYSRKVEVDKVKALRKEVGIAWNKAEKGRLYAALTINGMLHSLLFGYNPQPALEALQAGAIAAGLSGKGPATVALSRERLKEMESVWSAYEGEIIRCKTNNRKAGVLKQ